MLTVAPCRLKCADRFTGEGIFKLVTGEKCKGRLLAQYRRVSGVSTPDQGIIVAEENTLDFVAVFTRCR